MTSAMRLLTWLNVHPLVVYFALTLGITWLMALPLIASVQGWLNPPLPLSLHYLTAYGPLLAAFIVTGLSEGSAGIRDLLARMVKWRVGWDWLLLSAFSMLIMFVIAAAVRRVVGQPWPDLRQIGQVNYLPNLGIGAWLLWIVTSGFGEETGWRGYALPHLQKQYSALVASLLLSAFWVLWHVPFFFYLHTYMQMGFALFPLFALGIVAGSIVYTWLYNSTGGSILMVALFHGAMNFVTAAKASDGFIAAFISTAFMVWAVVIVIVCKPANLSYAQKELPPR